MASLLVDRRGNAFGKECIAFPAAAGSERGDDGTFMSERVAGEGGVSITPNQDARPRLFDAIPPPSTYRNVLESFNYAKRT